MEMKLVAQFGSFELWAEGKNHAVVIAVSGRDQTNRVTVQLLVCSGNKAVERATRYFDALESAHVVLK